MKDPGIDRKMSHPLDNIILISIAALICGAETWDEVEDLRICERGREKPQPRKQDA
jgi:hypothetical protein